VISYRGRKSKRDSSFIQYVPLSLWRLHCTGSYMPLPNRCCLTYSKFTCFLSYVITTTMTDLLSFSKQFHYQFTTSFHLPLFRHGTASWFAPLQDGRHSFWGMCTLIADPMTSSNKESFARWFSSDKRGLEFHCSSIWRRANS
jgi:hypothetical protein